MLRSRSISTLQICLLLVSLAQSQYYNPDYTVSHDTDSPDHGGYTHTGAEETHAEDDRPDYSKYYKNDGASSSLLAGAGPAGGFHAEGKETEGGFVSPLDFSGFFGATQFGAESNQKQSLPVIPVQNPFHFQDALKQNSTGFVDGSEFSANFANAPNFELEVGKHFSDNSFEPKPDNSFVAPKDAAYKSKSKPQSYKSEVDDLNGYKEPAKKIKYDTKPKNDYIAPINNYNNYVPILPTLSSYTGGKINHLAPVKTYVPQLFPATKHTNAPLNIQSTPYTNYNFQPNLDIKSTLAPLNSQYNIPSTANSYYAAGNDFVSPTEFAQPSEYKSQKVQNANCQQIAKNVSPDDISHGRFRRQADKMNCFLCKDPKTGGSYEQCSYTSDPEDDKSYFRGHAEKYSTKTYVDPEDHSRNRRDIAKKDKRKRKRNDDKEEYVNPFNYEKDSSHKFNSKPKEFDESESYYKAPDFSHYEKDSENYEFGPEYFSEAATPEKSYSELQSEELKKNGQNCKKIKKDSMTCMICSNPKTGGNYEQCSYTSEPNEKKFAYVKEKKYNSNDPDPEEKTVESTETKPTIQRNKSRFQTPKNVEFSASIKHPKQIKTSGSDYDYIPHHFIAESKQQQNYFGKDSDDDDSKNKKGGYVYKLFPEYAEKESKNQEIKQRPGYEYKSELPEYFTAEESKKDVDSVLQEFTKKDRSKCKKIAKDKMTCYLCTDDKGVQHEECMFVSESQPKSSHIAYHEVKEFSSDPKRQNNEEVTADTKPVPEIKSPREIKRKTKKVNPQIKEVEAEPTENVKVIGKTPRIVRRRTNISKEYLPQESKRSEVKVDSPKSASEDEEEELKEPESPDGAYASELVPVFSKQFGMTLPKYMLEVTEGEQVFDEVVKSG